MKSYRDLDVYNKAFDLAIRVHKMSLKLPKFELYETGSQIRRASKSVKSNIVEGYGRREYKQEFIRFLIFAEASQLETLSDLETIQVLYTEFNSEVEDLIKEYTDLGRKLNAFKEWVRKNWKV